MLEPQKKRNLGVVISIVVVFIAVICGYNTFKKDYRMSYTVLPTNSQIITDISFVMKEYNEKTLMDFVKSNNLRTAADVT